MSLLIPRPRSPGNEIDVYLCPLIDKLKELWESGVKTYDKMAACTFNLHAAVIWTINDFPAYGNLSIGTLTVSWHVQYVMRIIIHQAEK